MAISPYKRLLPTLGSLLSETRSTRGLDLTLCRGRYHGRYLRSASACSDCERLVDRSLAPLPRFES